MSSRDWTAVPTAELLATIATCGLALPPGLPAEIVRRGAETREPLCALAADPAVWAAPNGPGAWTSIFAIFLLGAIGDARSAATLVEVLRTRDLGDWLFDGVAGILAWQGRGAIELLAATASDPAVEVFARAMAAQALYTIGAREAAARGEVAARLTAIVTASDDPEFQGLIADAVARVDDPETQRALDAVFAEERIWTGMIDLGSIEEIRKEPRWSPLHGVEDPMAFFDEDALDHLRRVEAQNDAWEAGRAAREAERAEREAQRAAHPEIARIAPSPGAAGARPVQRSEPRVGRNDPCPCGSGKKYKKCHGA